eukprot:12698506-Alexandrium_andersonii.AAC.1
MGLRRSSLLEKSRRPKAPSRASETRSDSHSTTPIPLDMACVSPDRVEGASRASLPERHTTGTHGASAPSIMVPSVSPATKPL